MKEGYIDNRGNIISYSLEDFYSISICPRYVLSYSLKEDTLYFDTSVALRSDYIISTLKLALEIFKSGLYRVDIYDLELSSTHNICSYRIDNNIDIEELCSTFNISGEDKREIKKLVVEYELT